MAWDFLSSSRDLVGFVLPPARRMIDALTPPTGKVCSLLLRCLGLALCCMVVLVLCTCCVLVSCIVLCCAPGICLCCVVLCCAGIVLVLWRVMSWCVAYV